MSLNHLGLFEGIGGFSLAARWAGWSTVAWCEWNEFGQQVLKYHFPKAIGHGDITQTDFSIYRGKIDIITGGFPCQPYSNAGKRLGKEDERHLWPEMLRAIREVQPRWVVGENVLGLVNWSGGLVFHEVQADLETEGYEVFPYVLPACSVNAPHRRDRVWFVAYKRNCFSSVNSNPKSGREGRLRNTGSEAGSRKSNKPLGSLYRIPLTANPRSEGLQRSAVNGGTESIGQERKEYFTRHIPSNWKEFPIESPIRNGDDGISFKLDGITVSNWSNESIKAGGNAIVPQVAFQIFQAINEYESTSA